MTDENEWEEIDFVPVDAPLPSLEEEESNARLLPMLEFARESTDDWRRYTTPMGVQLRLPAELEMMEQDPDIPEQTHWSTPDGGTFTLMKNARGGSLAIGFGEGAVRYVSEGQFQTPFAGRAATASLVRIVLEEGVELFVAGATASVDASSMVGVSIMAASAAQRDRLLNALATIETD